MFDRSLVQSGFDIEMLVSEQYLSYLLLSQVESGELDLFQEYNGQDVLIHPPGFDRYRTSYRDGDSELLPDPSSRDTFKLKLLPGDTDAVRSLAFTHADSVLLVHTDEGQVRAWNYENYSVVPERGFEVPLSYCSAFDAAAGRLAVAVYPQSIELWDVASKARTDTLTGHSGSILSVAWSGDGERLISGSLDRSVRVWDAATGTGLAVFQEHSEVVYSAKLSLNGGLAVSGDGAGVIHLWEVATGTVLRTFDLGQLVVSVALSISNTHIAGAGRDGVIRYWEVGTGDVVQTMSGHTASVTALEFDPRGDRLASASEDQTIRIWRLSDGSELEQHDSHNASPRVLRYTTGGSKLATGSDSGVAWVWDRTQTLTRVHPMFCEATFEVSLGGSAAIGVQILATAELGFELDANGLERYHTLQLSFSRFTDGTRMILASLPGSPDVPELESFLRRRIDVNVPLELANGQRIQQVRSRKFADGDERALGIYINLALRSGPQPDSFVVRRGRVGDAINFLGSEAIAFATSPGLFALLGPDFKYRQAEEDPPGSGDYRYPLRRNPLNRYSRRVGKIYSVTVGHRQTSSLPSGGALLARLDVEYFTDLVDLDLTINLILDPVVQPDKTVKWERNVQTDTSLAAAIVTELSSLGSLAFGGIFGTYLLFELAIEPAIDYYAEGELDGKRLAGILDAIPFHLAVAHKSWDPFYETIHTVSVLLEEDPVADERGFAFSAPAVWLDRKLQLHTDRVIRDEHRTGVELTGALFRVRDYDDKKALYERERPAPGTDRLPFIRPDALGEPDMVGLTFDQFEERRHKHRIFGQQWLVPKRVHIVNNQIGQLLCLTWRELEDLRKSLGVGEMSDVPEDEIARILRLDLSPEEMYRMQNEGLVLMQGVQVVMRIRADGTPTYYFRDRPDGNASDNLLNLPAYTPPYVPPT